jgi:hypothetical protein
MLVRSDPVLALLWIPSWQCQKASDSYSVDFKGENLAHKITTTSGFQVLMLQNKDGGSGISKVWRKAWMK